jgi:hypothetical protein
LADPGAADAVAATVKEASSTALFKAESDCTGDAASLNCEGYWESYCRFRIVPFFTSLPKNGERHPIPNSKASRINSARCGLRNERQKLCSNASGVDFGDRRIAEYGFTWSLPDAIR